MLNLYGIAGPSYRTFTDLPGCGAQQDAADALLDEFFDFENAALDLSTREPSIPKSNHEASAGDEATKLPSLQQCSDHSTPYFPDAVPYTPGLVTEYPDSGFLQKDSIGPNTESHKCIWSDQQLEDRQNLREDAAARIYGIANISSHAQPLTLRSKPPSDSNARPQDRKSVV